MAYSNALEKLSQSGNINKDTANRALNESNIDRMAQEAKQQQQQPQQQSGKQPIKMPTSFQTCGDFSCIKKNASKTGQHNLV
jgi:hypothetical protein